MLGSGAIMKKIPIKELASAAVSLKRAQEQVTVRLHISKAQRILLLSKLFSADADAQVQWHLKAQELPLGLRT